MAKDETRGWMRFYFGVTLWKRVLAGLALGIIAGLALRAALGPDEATALTTTWFRPFGDAFIRLIRMLVVPLIFTTLAAGILAMGDPAKLGGIGLKAFGLYILTTLFAVVIGIGMGAILQPGTQANFADVVPSQIGADAPGIIERLLAIIPTNPFEALAGGDILAVIFFSILLGVTMLVMREAAKPVADVITFGAEVMLKMTHWIMELAPIGVFFLLAWVAATQGLATFTSVALLAACVYVGCLIHMAVVYGGLVRVVLGLPIVRFFRGMFDAQAVAYSTSSSNATLPITISCARDNLGVSNAVAGSVIPLGATINMDGTSLYLGVLAMFAAQAFGFELGFADYAIIALTATLASIGTAGIPSASLFLLATVLSAIGATPEQTALMVGFLLPFDRPLDMMRTLTNVTGDGAVAVAVAKWEGELDEETFRRRAVV
jgi:Na+/H+-dicarboxylate symporter